MKRILLLLLALWSSHARATVDEPHFAGSSRDKHQFRFSLIGGEFLGQRDGLQSIRVPIRVTRRGRELPVLDRCVYIVNPRQRQHDRIQCDEVINGSLSGVVYARGKTSHPSGPADDDELVCIKRCSAKTPTRLKLNAEEDNG